MNVRWRDLDALDHVNHAVFLTYLEEGRDAFYLVKKELFDRCSWNTFELRLKEILTIGPHDVSRLSARSQALGRN